MTDLSMFSKVEADRILKNVAGGIGVIVQIPDLLSELFDLFFETEFCCHDKAPLPLIY